VRKMGGVPRVAIAPKDTGQAVVLGFGPARGRRRAGMNLRPRKGRKARRPTDPGPPSFLTGRVR